MYTIYDLASYYCYHYDMTYKKLQNVLYYTYVWSMLLSDEHQPLFDAVFTAKTHGPRELRLEALNKRYGFNYIEVAHDPLVPFSQLLGTKVPSLQLTILKSITLNFNCFSCYI